MSSVLPGAARVSSAYAHLKSVRPEEVAMNALNRRWKVAPHGKLSAIDRALTVVGGLRMPLGERRVFVG